MLITMKARLAIVALLCTLSFGAQAAWHSVQQVSVGSAAPCGGYQGPGDVIPGAVIGAALRAWSASTCGNAFANVCVSGTCADMLTSASTGAIVPQTINGTTCPNASTTDCVVNKWYDQTVSGDCSGSCDFVQDSTEQRGILTTTCPASYAVCILFPTSSATYLQAAGNLTLTAPFTAMAVTNYTAGGSDGGVYIAFGATSAGLGHGAGASGTVITCNGTTNHSYTAADGTWWSQLQLCASAAYNLFLDGVSQGSQSWTAAVQTAQPYVGGIFASGPVIYEVEVGIWSSDVSADAAALTTNQNSYYGGL